MTTVVLFESILALNLALPAGLPVAGAGNRLPETAFHFQRNLGQTDPQVLFFARASGYILFLTANKAVLSSTLGAQPAVRMQWLGARATSRTLGVGELPGRSHYLIGRDARRWIRDVPHYAGVCYEDAYPGIDLIFSSTSEGPRFDLVLDPGADPSLVRLDFEGTEEPAIDRDGSLVLHVHGGAFRFRRPLVYQRSQVDERSIPASFALLNDARGERHIVGFRLGAYDPTRPLVIDPVIGYLRRLAGSSIDQAHGLALDSARNVYVTGSTVSPDFPARNPVQGDAPRSDVFVSKLDPAGNLVYSTYIGGDGDDTGYAIAVDGDGNAHVTGSTNSTDFPAVGQCIPVPPLPGCAPQDPAQSELGGALDAFVLKLDVSGGAFGYSTYLGGSKSDQGFAIDLGPAGNAYVTGDTGSSDFPVRSNLHVGPAGGTDTFVTKVLASGLLDFSTYLDLGGEELGDVGLGIAVDAAANVYIAGQMNREPGNVPSPAAILAKLGAGGTQLVYSVTFGAPGQPPALATARDVVVDAEGSAYVTGMHPFFVGGDDELAEALIGPFVHKFDPLGNEVSFRRFGGRPSDQWDVGYGIALAPNGNAYVAGVARSTGFELANPLQATYGGGPSDAFIASVSPDWDLSLSTFLGGSGEDRAHSIAVDAAGDVYVAGLITGGDAFVAKLQDAMATARGVDVMVELAPHGRVTFSSVSEAGETTAVASAKNPGPPAPEFSLLGTYTKVTTTAATTGATTVCLAYPESGLSPDQEQDLRLLQLADGAWSDVTSVVDREANLVCGRVDSLSWFALALATPSRAFRRGDCNDDSTVDISDPVFSLGSLFLGDGKPSCDDACDSNDDGAVDISDAINTLGVLFLGNGVIPPPGTMGCGVDSTEDDLGCRTFSRCP